MADKTKTTRCIPSRTPEARKAEYLASPKGKAVARKRRDLAARDAQIARRYRKGPETLRELAEEFGIAESTAQVAISKNGVKGRDTGLSKADRFWPKVRIGGPGECWPWTAGSTNEYGHFYANGETLQAPRVAYELAHGPIPDSLMIRHTCDNPPCCNPAHLEPGTHVQNMLDMTTRGRSLRGARSHRSTLTDQQ